ncbi:hypothetical protein I2537_003882 [Salmonella enterica]|uniref:Secreted protein n=1 Tax=Salmonella enterica subsp. houtenae serovar 48:z4,z32:- TaxID=2577535 RepID=A0A729G9Z2_SALHO|nr:hypothetical protein [Salmonella enterica subsp. houtenae]EEA9138964.1 hypothetical protein [Salmonella enterica subsp. enterica]EGQ2098288.1 hypothetical protein [Salmonella enterica]EKR1449347.1 hypothetical protein [Salmonella enterica subsp. houtenae serovar 48:z4,z32:-]EDW3820319.1 hypothetical protein [Salmonella enterica subsp. houtenae]
MKKSMAGQGAAGALLLAGLMMSAGAMAASGEFGYRDHQCSDSDVHLQCCSAHGGEF